MKIRYYSDIHLEFGMEYSELAENIGEDVVVLAGDIHLGIKGIEWAQKALADRQVIYVIGNHEFYGGHWSRTLTDCRKAAAGSNVTFLENDQVTLSGVTFLGCALWTDFDGWKSGTADKSKLQAGLRMNDFRRIWTLGGEEPMRTLTPDDTIERHAASSAWLEASIAASSGPTVVVTHHGPSMLGCQPQYQDDVLTPAFLNDRHDLIRPPVRAWIFGHTHHSCRLDINGVPVLSNQRGYPLEPHPGFDPYAMIEITGES